MDFDGYGPYEPEDDDWDESLWGGYLWPPDEGPYDEPEDDYGDYDY